MIIIQGLVYSFAIAFWLTCGLASFWLARETFRSRRYTHISQVGNFIYDSVRLLGTLGFIAAGLVSIFQVGLIWQEVLKL